MSDKWSFIEGFNSVNTLTSIPINKQTIYATLTANDTLTVPNDLEAGRTIQIFCNITGNRTITIGTGTNRVIMGDNTFVVNNQWLEIHVTSVNGTIYNIRGAAQS